MSTSPPDGAPPVAGLNLEELAGLARAMFAGLPSGGADPKLAGAPPVAALGVGPGVTPTTAFGDLSLSDEALPHYAHAPTLDAPVRPHSPALGGFGKPLAPPTDPQPPLLALSASIPSSPGLIPQRDAGVAPKTGLLPNGPSGGGLPAIPAESDGAFYFLRPRDVPQPGSPLLPGAPASSSGYAVPTSGGLDANLHRQDFPILRETVRGKPLVWLDNAATTQKPRAVIDRLSHFYEHENSNIHRAAHELAARSTDAYEAARESSARFINAPSSSNIVFVRGTTEAINLVSQSWGRDNLGPGDAVLITHLEHHANIVPWVRLSKELGFALKVAPVDDRGDVILDEYARLLDGSVKLVSFTHVSNALGTVTPAAVMIGLAHAAGAKVLLDGAQSVSHMPVDVTALDPDFFVFSAHKVFGPTGIGVLYGKSDVLEGMSPWQGGGNMIEDVTFDSIRYAPPPMKFEAGTGNIADAVGLGAALDYLMKVGMPTIAAHEHDLLVYGEHLLRQIRGVRIIGEAREKAGVISFVMDGKSVPDVGKALSAEGIAVRAGHHCAQPILRRMGLEATVRPSLALYNTHADLDALARVLRRLAD
jgi:cysteine desulfurase/selenocysteine lyase